MFSVTAAIGESAARAISSACSSSGRPVDRSMWNFEEPMVVSACARSSSSSSASAISSASCATLIACWWSPASIRARAASARTRALDADGSRSATSDVAREKCRSVASRSPRYQAPCARKASASAAGSTAPTSSSASRASSSASVRRSSPAMWSDLARRNRSPGAQGRRQATERVPLRSTSRPWGTR